jgi:multicomponent Na+:H+ antiporter subunit G
MTALELVSAGSFLFGAFFFLAGTLGLLRFPDVYTRLHALTKTDNVGLGLIVVGLMLESTSVAEAAKLILIWLLVLASSSISSQLIGRYALVTGTTPWRKR